MSSAIDELLSRMSAPRRRAAEILAAADHLVSRTLAAVCPREDPVPAAFAGPDDDDDDDDDDDEG